ncbi:MAG TPA: thiamine phosphate synthase [Hyphomonadaceae bacterium]|nr:thiamine phosphate synthase [Hyphomonadaceae bacterium]
MLKSQAQAVARRKLLAAARAAKPAFDGNGRALPRAWFLTDPKRTPHPERILEKLPPGLGVIYRHYGVKERFAVGAKLARICRKRRLILLVAADPVLARRIGADGVHWPERRLRGGLARRSGLATLSAHSVGAIRRAGQLGADAVFLSPVFASASPSAAGKLGAPTFRRMASGGSLPIYALGGVNAGNASSVMTHAAGWAAIEAVIEAWES